MDTGQEVACLNVPALPIIGGVCGETHLPHLPVRLEELAARLETAAMVREIDTPRVEPHPILVLPVIGRRADLEPAELRIDRQRIYADTAAECLAMSIDADVVDAGDRVAYHRLREKREMRPIRHPRGVIYVLPQLSPLQPTAKFRAQVVGRYQRFGSAAHMLGDHPVAPQRPL